MMRYRLALCAMLLAGPLLADAQALDFSFEDDGIERPVRPAQCEQWEALIEARQASDDPLEQSLGEVYGSDDFTWCQTRRVRVREQRESRWDFNLPGMGFLAEFARVLAIAVLVALLIWALWRWREQIGQLAGRASRRDVMPIEGPRHEPLAEERPLPPDISAGAHELWNQGRARDAVSLLYRGALARLLAHVRRADSRTEREVQRLLRSQGLKPATLSYMDSLIACWQRTAWAQQPPSKEEFDQLAALWPKHCSEPSVPGASP